MTDSSTGGYVVDNGVYVPLRDATLQDFLHDWIAGITGIANNLVRPRWQPEQPNIPGEAVDWCAFGVPHRHTIGLPFEEHIPASTLMPNGFSQLRSHQEFTMLVTFYGPNAEWQEMRLTRGMYLAQNQESLELSNMALVGHGDPTIVPELIKERWTYRVDCPIYFRRQIILNYPILNILQSSTDINNEHYNEPTTSG